MVEAGAGQKTLWEFFSSLRFYERWFASFPSEIDLDYELLSCYTYTGVRFQEDNFHSILLAPCKERGLLRRNILDGAVQEIPPVEDVGYNPAYHEAILSVDEEFLRGRITRTELADSHTVTMIGRDTATNESRPIRFVPFLAYWGCTAAQSMSHTKISSKTS